MSKAGSRAPRGRRIAWSIAASGVALGVVSLVGTGIAFADNGAAGELSITSAVHQTIVTKGRRSCAVTVSSDLTVVNLSGTTLTYSSVTPRVTWEVGHRTGVLGSSSITVVSSGTPPLEQGDTLPKGQQQSYRGYTTSFVIPARCSRITYGDLQIVVSDQFGSGSADEQFIADGVFSPIDAAGGLGLAALLGGGLAMTYRRWHRPSGTRPQAAAGGKA